MAVEREIRFLVTDGEPPAGGRRIVQAYLLRGRTTARIRLDEEQGARLTVKWPATEGRHEFEWPLPEALARAVLRLPLPLVEKTRRWDGRLEVDRLAWPAGVVLAELELAAGEGPDLRDPAARQVFMAAHRPAWVRAWHDVTDDPAYTNARLARRRTS
jgi:CYTH domain-containing protein